MTDEPQFAGIFLRQWDDAFRAGMPEFAATSFAFTREGNDLIRIAFGNAGPYIDESGSRSGRFTHAVTLPPEIAVDLAQAILTHYAKPKQG